MHVCLVNLTHGGLSGGYSKYLRSIEPLLRADPRITRLDVFSPPEVVQSNGVAHRTWPARDRWRGHPVLRSSLSRLTPDVVFFPTAASVDCGPVPTVVMVRNMEPLLVPWEGNTVLEGVKNTLRSRQARWSCARASRVIAVSEHVRSYLTARWRLDPAKVGVVPHGVEKAMPAGAPPAGLADGADAPFLFTAGSVRPARGLEDVIQALAIVSGRGLGLRLVVGGEATPGMDGYRERMVRLAERLGVASRITWAGQLTAAEMGWCFQNAAAFVMTSRAEACPNIVLEAMSHGALSVSTDQPPMPEFFASTALMYRRRDPASLADRIVEAACLSPAAGGALRDAARARASEFTWEAAVDGQIRELVAACETRQAGAEARTLVTSPAAGAREAPPPRGDQAESPTVLTLVDYYLPGIKAGGPIRSIRHLVERLGTAYRFRIVTRDRDFRDSVPYPDVESRRWLRLGDADVLYLEPGDTAPLGILRVLRSTPHDVLYLNSLFSPRLSFVPLLLRLVGAIPPRPVVLAPRGELCAGALATGFWGRWMPRGLARRLSSPRFLKKHLYLFLGRSLGLFRGIVWQAASADERDDILRHVGRDATVVIAQDLGAAAVPPVVRTAKHPGRLRAVYLSRVVQKKNLSGAIEILSGMTAEVDFTIFGPIEDERYWAECRAALERLPPNVRARYGGSLGHEAVTAALADADLFFLPTWGESFGHVILEALVAGCPVVISDCTPWRGLQELGVGWELPLDAPDRFRDVLSRVAAMDEAEFGPWSTRASAYGRMVARAGETVEDNRALFDLALGGRR
jgi:glycosyltransferase involved in cell wall biosynthesis